MKKYKLVKSDFKMEQDVKLYRIKALKKFGNVRKNTLGGYIEKEANLSHYGNAWVSGDAHVFGEAVLTKTAINILRLDFNITICDNTIQIGCKQFKKSEIASLKYKDYKDDCNLKTFNKLKNIILATI